MSWVLFTKVAESELAKRRKLRREMLKRKNKPSTIKKYICGSAQKWKKITMKWRNRPEVKGYWYTVMHYLHRDGSVKTKPIILAPRQSKGKKPPLKIKFKGRKKLFPICKPSMLEKYKKRIERKNLKEYQKRLEKHKKKLEKNPKKSFALYADMASRDYFCATPLAWNTRRGRGAWSCTLKFKREDGSVGTEPYIQSRDCKIKPRHVTVRGIRIPFCQDC